MEWWRGSSATLLRWFGHMETMAENEIINRVYMSMVDMVGARGRPVVKCVDRMLEYVREMGERRMTGLQHARRECKDRNKWRLFYCGHPLGGPLRNRPQI